MKYLMIILLLAVSACNQDGKSIKKRFSSQEFHHRAKKLCSCKKGVLYTEGTRHVTCVDGTKIHWVEDKTPGKSCLSGY